jgi:protein-serine/threonine kinase
MPGFYDGQHDSNSRIRNANMSGAAGPSSAPPNQTHFDGFNTTAPIGDDKFPNPSAVHPSAQQQQNNRPYRQHMNNSQASENFGPPQSQSQQFSQRTPSNSYPQGMGGEEQMQQQQQQRKGVLQKSRRFADGYDDQSSGGNKGSSGSSKKVMDFFRRMGRQRTGSRD